MIVKVGCRLQKLFENSHIVRLILLVSTTEIKSIETFDMLIEKL